MGVFPNGDGTRVTVAAGGIMGAAAGQQVTGEVELVRIPFSGNIGIITATVNMVRVNNVNTQGAGVSDIISLVIPTPLEITVNVPATAQVGTVADPTFFYVDIELTRNMTGLGQIVVDLGFDPTVMVPVLSAGTTIATQPVAPMEMVGVASFPNMGVFPNGDGTRVTVAAGGVMGAAAGQQIYTEDVVLVRIPFTVVGNVGDIGAVTATVNMVRVNNVNTQQPALATAGLINVAPVSSLEVVDGPTVAVGAQVGTMKVPAGRAVMLRKVNPEGTVDVVLTDASGSGAQVEVKFTDLLARAKQLAVAKAAAKNAEEKIESPQ